jgi:hypothetical protein
MTSGFGCTTTQPEALDTEHQGIAEIRITADPRLATSITRVTVETSGTTQELVQNPNTGTFDGTLVLASGTYSLVVRAFSREVVVGASNPISVDVATGVVTRGVARILDLTVDTPVYGPLFDSLTVPTTVQAGDPATFTISVIAPAGNPVTYSWTSDCADSMFSAPEAATTNWSKPSDGSCQITAAAVSNGFSISQTFVIVVFPAGTTNGAVNLSGAFIIAPGVQLSLGNCTSFSQSSQNSSCPTTIASPTSASLTVGVSGWGLGVPDSLEVSDNCGGRARMDLHTSDFIFGSWLPPAAGGLCILTARAVNSDGVVGTASMAILTRPGAAAITGATAGVRTAR